MLDGDDVTRGSPCFLAIVGLVILLAAVPGLVALSVAPHLFTLVAALAIACERWLGSLRETRRASTAVWMSLAFAWSGIAFWAVRASSAQLQALETATAAALVGSAALRADRWRAAGVPAW